ncbi:hypothetical protein ACFL59_06090 [Planctomycetota bacterium]
MKQFVQAREMRIFLVALLAIGLTIALAPAALAQTSTGGTGTGAGTGTGPGASADHGAEIDLPVGNPADGMAIPDEDPRDDPNEDDGPRLYDEDLPTETDSIIYVIDISGSMDWGNSSYTGLDGNPTTGSKLERAKVELIKSVAQLTEEFEFNIIAYDCSMRRWSGTRQRATAANKSAARQWVQGLSAGGATGTGPAGALALQEKDNFTIAILSDGAPNCGASGIPGHLNMILSANSQGAKCHTFGIAATGQFEAFLRSIADQTGGNYYPVP